MTESLAYRDIRRQLLSKNPYFQQDLIEVRRKLGLPEAGFSEAVQKLGEGIPRHPTSLLLGKPNLASLKEKARRLGLPLDDWVAEREAQCAERGMNFEQLIDQVGWGALPIWGFALAEWWIARERKLAGLEPLTFNSQAESQGQSSQLLNTCLPSAQAALSLARRYRLGDDYTPTTASLILGCPPGGGEADIVIEHRRDGAGLRVVLPCVRYDCTLAKWQQIFLDAIQPTLFRHASKLPSEVPFHEAIKEARRRAKPGKPPYTQKTLETHLRMW
ncbi:MAG TPA: hypothetical protein VFA32_19515, partial [Dehalococcoidia bacterium]|nr:hypothetical protein [Dehalococcoidia bacterium]